MREVLQDIIRYTHDLGDFDAFKLITDTDGSSVVKTSSFKDLNVLMEAKIKDKLSAFINNHTNKKTAVGFSRLNVLAGYLRTPFFNEEDSKLSLVYREDGTPRELIFKSNIGHTCTYRMMAPEIAKQKIKTLSLTHPIENFDIVFKPTEKFIKDFQLFAGILGKFSSNFSFKIEDDTLYMMLGEDDTAKLPVTTTDAEKMNNMLNWPIKQVLGILTHAPDLEKVTIHISNEFSLMDIHVETDQAYYSFKLPAS